MIWLQASVCFVLWVGYGLWMRRSSEHLRLYMHGRSRLWRSMLGSVGLLAGLALLAAGVFAVFVLDGVVDGSLRPWAWAVVAVVGAGFIHMQVLGAAAMITLMLDGETARREDTSICKEKEQQ